MKTRPVCSYEPPHYPTRLSVLDNPDILRRHLPPGWLRSAEVAGAVGFFLAVNSCALAGEKQEPMTPDKPAVVAPIFKYIERGPYPTMVGPPAKPLTEDEALLIIKEELAKRGVSMTDKGITLNEDTGLKADRMDETKHIVVEFISPEDMAALPESKKAPVKGEKANQLMAERVKKEAKGVYFGAFYEQNGYVPRSREILRIQVKEFADWLKAQGAI